MAITFSGVGSGLPVDQIIDATIEAKSYRLYKYQDNQTLYKQQQSALDTVEAKYNSFDSTLEKLIDSKIIHAFDLFDKKSTSLSDDSIANVSVSAGADSGNVEVEVNSLVEPPSLSTSNFAGSITDSVKLADLGIIAGTFSIAFEDTVNNKGILLEVEVDIEDTLSEFFDEINTAITDHDELSGSIATTVDASGQIAMDFSAITTGGIQLDADNPIGNSSSNVADVFGFSSTGNIMNSTPKSSLNLDGTLFGNNANINGWNSDANIPETINIGGLDIEITETTTLRSLMNTVNDDDDCQVSMDYNQATNSINFHGKDEFYSDYIYFSGNTFLSEIGATVNGSTETASQTARQPGEIVIDGETIAIKSNKLTPAETGLKGITMTLNSKTEVGEPLTISISDSTEELEKALEDLVGSFNSIVDTVKQYTFADTEAESYGVLRTEYSLQRMQNDIKMGLSTGVEDDLEYKALSLIGISSAGNDEGHLEFDSSEFLEAFKDNPEDVKALLIGTKDESIEGVLEKIKEQMDVYLDVQTGYFATKDDSLISSVESLNKSIENEEERLESIRQRLVNQYSSLDSTMTSMNSQMSALSQL